MTRHLEYPRCFHYPYNSWFPGGKQTFVRWSLQHFGRPNYKMMIRILMQSWKCYVELGAWKRDKYLTFLLRTKWHIYFTLSILVSVYVCHSRSLNSSCHTSLPSGVLLKWGLRWLFQGHEMYCPWSGSHEFEPRLDQGHCTVVAIQTYTLELCTVQDPW